MQETAERKSAVEAWGCSCMTGVKKFSEMLAVVLPMMLLSGCFGDSYSWHQKLTAVIETPEGEVLGSAVTSIEWTGNFFSGGWGGADKHQKTIGEAVTVDLGNGRYLFALLGGEATANLATQLVMDTTKRAWSEKAFEGVHKLPRPTTITPKLYPLLVTFDDINDPKTVKKVDPTDLAAAFGSGYSLKSITLEITDEPVTKGRVEKVLGGDFFKKWGAIHKEALARGLNDSYFDSLMAELSRGDFVRKSK